MISLTLAALFWLAVHLLVAGRLRPLFAERLGEGGFRGFFSGLSALGVVWLLLAYRGAPFVPLWPALPGARWIAAALMLVACEFLAFGAAADNPTSPIADRLPPGEPPVRGITRITRHPMLWAFALWAVAHLLANGDLAGALLFGAILLTALNGMLSIDAKRRRKLGPSWDGFAARTSRIPFAAILAGRTEFRPSELAAARLVVGVLLFAALLWAHGHLFGRPPLAL